MLDTLQPSPLPAMVSIDRDHLHWYLTSSYIPPGLPLLYVGGLTVPLGFARSEEMRKYHSYDYGYEQA